MWQLAVMYKEIYGMIIKGKTTVRINEWEYDVDVKFLVPLHKLEIVIPITSAKALEIGDFLYPRRFKEIVIINEIGEVFTAYECIFYKRITKIDMITIFGQYKTLIKGRNIPTSGNISFHFEGLDCLFGKYTDFSNLEVFQKENNWSLSSNNETVEVVAKINEIYSIDSLIALLAKVRECFEFLIDREIYVDRIVYSDGVEASIEIINDKLLMSKNDCLFNQTNQEKPEMVVKNINQWLLHYETYKEVIYIWKKTIYNRQVSDEDIFIWRCQSLELLCTLYEPLFFEAKQKMKNPSPKADPNLSNFLEALNVKRKFIECDKTYFNEVKNVRNVYTHYNPKKHVSEREWWNASHLINSALKVALGYVMELDIEDIGFFFLIPPGTKEERRR